MTHFQAYLLTRLDPFQDLFISIITITILLIIANIIVQIVCLVGTTDSYGDCEKEWKDRSKKSFSYFKLTMPFLLTMLALKSLIPSTKEAAFIYIAPAIVNNQDIQKTIKKVPELSGLGLEYLGEILKQQIDETKGEVINEVKKSIK